MSDWNKQIIEEFRANEGRVGGNFSSASLLLLHTIGAKSGQERINPLVTFEDGERLVIVASKGGATSNPDWYYNLVANPEVNIEYGTETFLAQATITSEPERTALYERMESTFATFSDYKKTANRVIPVLTLSRLS